MIEERKAPCTYVAFLQNISGLQGFEDGKSVFFLLTLIGNSHTENFAMDRTAETQQKIM